MYGFTSQGDSITWTVWAPETGKYRVAVQYTGKMYLSDQAQPLIYGNKSDPFGLQGKTYDPECVVEISANNSSLEADLQRLTQYNEPDKVAGSRQWLPGLLPLREGENQITLRFSKLSDHQIRVALAELKNGTLGKSTVSLGIKSIELVRPEVWQAMEQKARRLRSETNWMVEYKYGLFIHWSLLSYPLYGNSLAVENFEWGVNIFDVEAFADMVEETGASWVLFTTCHGAHYFPAPVKTLDEVLAGRTSRRDLIAELADALGQRSIRLLLYYNLCTGDNEFRKAAGMEDKNPQRWFDFLEAFASEVSQRYQKQIAGWGYIDSSVTMYEYNMPMESFVRAMKAGNPNAVIGISSHWWAELTPFNELQTADCGGSLIEPLHPAVYQNGGRYEGLQPHFTFTLDGSWRPLERYNGIIRRDSRSEGGPVRPFIEYVEYFRRMDAAGVPLTANMLITQDVTRTRPFVNPQTLELMRHIRRAVWGG